jgi:hypothetical protein
VCTLYNFQQWGNGYIFLRLSLYSIGTNRTEDIASNCSSTVACVSVAAIVFTESLPSSRQFFLAPLFGPFNYHAIVYKLQFLFTCILFCVVPSLFPFLIRSLILSFFLHFHIPLSMSHFNPSFLLCSFCLLLSIILSGSLPSYLYCVYLLSHAQLSLSHEEYVQSLQPLVL